MRTRLSALLLCAIALVFACGLSSCSSPYFAEAPLRYPFGDSHRNERDQYFGGLGNPFAPTDFVPPGVSRQ